jgi:hypothetical protein
MIDKRQTYLLSARRKAAFALGSSRDTDCQRFHSGRLFTTSDLVAFSVYISPPYSFEGCDLRVFQTPNIKRKAGRDSKKRTTNMLNIEIMPLYTGTPGSDGSVLWRSQPLYSTSMRDHGI